MTEPIPKLLSKADRIPGAYDGYFPLPPNIQLAPKGIEISLKGSNPSPVELDIEPEVIQEWMSPVINSLFMNRAIMLVEGLGLYQASEVLPVAASIVDRVNQGVRIDLHLKDTEGNDLTVLDLFDGDELAAKYILWCGLYRSVLSVLSMENLDLDAQTEFTIAAEQLGISHDLYTHSLEQVNDSELLHQWLFRDGSILSIHHELQVLLLGQADRLDLEPLLEMASMAILYPDTYDEMKAAGIFPEGEITRSSPQTELIEEDRQHVVSTLLEDPIARVHFIMYILSDRSKLYLLQWIRYILSKPSSNGYYGTQ